MLRVGLLLLIAGCGARTGLPGGDRQGEGGAAGQAGTGGSPPQCGIEICNGVDDDCDGAVDEECVVANGCADGTREGFVDELSFPDIAGCSGGFSVPGVLVGLAPSCGQTAGNDSQNPNGNGCSAADLCSEGFVVCESAAAVAARAPAGCSGITSEPETFFITRQTGTGCGICALGSSFDPACEQCSCAGGCAPSDTMANDVFGCGTVGDFAGGCDVLDRFSNDQCQALPATWTCFGNSCGEALAVSKTGPGNGGALCCRAVVAQPPG